MELSTILWFYIILIFVLFIFLYHNTFHFLEAFIIALTIGTIFILIVYPPQEIDIETENMSCIALYIFIITITILIILIYAICAAWRVRRSQDLICFPK